MNNQYLLTYNSNGNATFEWFKSRNDMDIFIVINNIKEHDIFEKIKIVECVDLKR